MALVESLSGIRGIYGKDLTEETAFRYAGSYFAFLSSKGRKPKIVVGMDTRLSGNALKSAVISALDCKIVDVGIAPTPAVEHAVRLYKADGGIIITASHNEPEWNGFKFLKRDGGVLEQAQMMELIKLNKGATSQQKNSNPKKIINKENELERDYLKFVFDVIGKQNIRIIRKKNIGIVVDANGGAGIKAMPILERAGVNAKFVNAKRGEFKRAVEPSEVSMGYLSKITKDTNAEFAAGFDCDADRVEILMGDGKMLSGNHILALCVNEALSNQKNPDKSIAVVNDATSGMVRKVAEKYGSSVVETGVGESNVVREMERYNALIGGEGSSSGVIMPPSKCRDGILSLMMIAAIASKKNKLENALKEIPQYFTMREKIEFDEKKHDAIKKYLRGHYSKKRLKLRETEGIKGSLKVMSGRNSFVWFRASKTEGSVFRIISDSDKEEESMRLMEEAVGVFKSANG